MRRVLGAGLPVPTDCPFFSKNPGAQVRKADLHPGQVS